MGEEHLDLLSELHRNRVFIRFGQIPGNLAGIFVFFAGDRSGICVRAAFFVARPTYGKVGCMSFKALVLFAGPVMGPDRYGGMNTMTLKSLAAAACISLATATTAISAPITLDFAFNDVTGNDVTGTFYGLDDNDGTSTATSFDLNFGLFNWTGLRTDNARDNLFEFAGGELVFASYRDFSINFTAVELGIGPVATLFEIDTLFGGNIGAPYGETRIVASTGGGQQGGFPTYTINPVAAVPLPAGGLLLLSAFGGVAALKRRKKRAA